MLAALNNCVICMLWLSETWVQHCLALRIPADTHVRLASLNDYVVSWNADQVRPARVSLPPFNDRYYDDEHADWVRNPHVDR